MIKDLHEEVTKYWIENYANKNMCSLCAQSGKIDTMGISTPAGMSVGRVNYCICPNGQSLRGQQDETGLDVRSIIKRICDAEIAISEIPLGLQQALEIDDSVDCLRTITSLGIITDYLKILLSEEEE